MESGETEKSTRASASSQSGWVDKHRRLLRRRSSEHDEVALVAMQRVPGEGKTTTTTTKDQILALYGVKIEEKEVDVPDPVICNSKVQHKPTMDVVDLTEEPSPQKDTTVATPRFKTYFDTHRGKVVRAFEDGTLEEAITEKGDGGFVVGHFGDGTTYKSEVPNVCFELKNEQRFFPAKKTKGRKKKQTNKKTKKAKTQKAKAKGSTKKAKAKGSPKKKCTPTANKKGKYDQLQPEDAEHDGAQQGEHGGALGKDEKDTSEDCSMLHAIDTSCIHIALFP